jgi:SAM-dependent methyltransferase
MVRAVDVPLAEARVLDIGCNQGGFLRLLADEAGIAVGHGYDPADASIEVAVEAAANRPLTFASSDATPATWGPFDVAFSHEVLYLLHDLRAHAADLRRALRPGGVYYAVMGTHDRNPMMPAWHRAYTRKLKMPPIYGLEDVVAAFTGEGFEGSVRRLPYDFIPTTGHTDGSLDGWLDYYYRHKVMFRFAKS